MPQTQTLCGKTIKKSQKQLSYLSGQCLTLARSCGQDRIDRHRLPVGCVQQGRGSWKAASLCEWEDSSLAALPGVRAVSKCAGLAQSCTFTSSSPVHTGCPRAFGILPNTQAQPELSIPSQTRSLLSVKHTMLLELHTESSSGLLLSLTQRFPSISDCCLLCLKSLKWGPLSAFKI